MILLQYLHMNHACTCTKACGDLGALRQEHVTVNVQALPTWHRIK
jgi:hypothetical protein